MPVFGDSTSMGAMVIGEFYRILAQCGQVVVPLLFVIGVVVSFSQRHNTIERERKVGQSESASSLSTMNWQQFEWVIAEIFSGRGFQVLQTGGNGPDGGVDFGADPRHGEDPCAN